MTIFEGAAIMTNLNTSLPEVGLVATADDGQGVPDIAPDAPAALLLRAAQTLCQDDAPPDVRARARRTVERLIGLSAAYGFGQCCQLYDQLTAGVFTKCTKALAARAMQAIPLSRLTVTLQALEL